MLSRLFPTQLSLGLAECAVAALVAFAALLLARRRAPELFREFPLAGLRGVAQIVAVGVVLSGLLRGPQWTALLVLGGMLLAAASIVRTRARNIPHAFRMALVSLTCGAGVILLLMVLLGVIPLRITMLVPVGSMVIANAMNTQSIFLDRFRGEILAHTGQVESALALGASPDAATALYLDAAFRSSLIPALDNVRSLGIVWIPGTMAGMVLSGASPVYAALYQFVVLATILSASALSSLVASTLVVRQVFSAREQLLLR